MWTRTRLPGTRTIRRLASLVVVAPSGVLALLLSGCTAGSLQLSGPLPTFSFSAQPIPTPTPPPNTPAAALADLARMPVKPPASGTPFTPSVFGAVRQPPRSANPCNSTDIVLQRDLVDLTLQDGSTCTVISGALFDAYSATWLWYLRSKPALNQVGVDHVVPLADAWATGGSSWPSNELNAFLNDPLELRATGVQEITAKANADASGWLPANPQGRCWYAVDQVAVKVTYGLWVTPTEKAALVKVLTGCASAATARATSSPPPAPSPTKAPPSPKPAAHLLVRKPAPKPIPLRPRPTVTITIIRTPSPSPSPDPTPKPSPSATL